MLLVKNTMTTGLLNIQNAQQRGCNKV